MSVRLVRVRLAASTSSASLTASAVAAVGRDPLQPRSPPLDPAGRPAAVLGPSTRRSGCTPGRPGASSIHTPPAHRTATIDERFLSKITTLAPS